MPRKRVAAPAGRPRPLAGGGALLVVLASLVLATPTRAADKRPRNLVLLIADGCGPASVTLARTAAGRPLALDSILVGSVRTASTDSRLTDSAAGATAYATGVKTRNRALGVDSDLRPMITLLEAARARGMATALVVKSRITDATPAAFAAHLVDRGQQDSVALLILEQRLDLVLGGGRARFLPASAGGSREDGRDLLAEARRAGYQVIGTGAELKGPLRLPALGLFAPGDMDYDLDRDPDRQPDLLEMTHAALRLLARHPRGFLLVVEGSRIDHAAHENDPAAHLREVLEFDAVVRAACAFARAGGHTLVVATSDHETGGLTLGRRASGADRAAFWPESLAHATASAQRMEDAIRAGADPVATVERGAGLAGLGGDERAALLEAVVRDSGLAEAIGGLESRRAGLGWATTGHTGADVGLYAFGPGRERFVGCMENARVGALLAEVMGLRLGPRRGAAGPPRPAGAR
jgi:alkaline phosphatase